MIQVFERMQEKNQDGSILIISHQERILNIADEIVVIADGQIVNHGPKEEILQRFLERLQQLMYVINFSREECRHDQD